jgi:hypothetical protein
LGKNTNDNKISGGKFMVPKFLLRRLYNKLSLRNVDVDGDGKFDAFSFTLKNRLMTTTLLGQTVLKVDGIAYPPEKIVLKFPERSVRATEISATSPLRFLKGAECMVLVEVEHGLPKGKHVVEITVASKEYGMLSFDFEDTVV